MLPGIGLSPLGVVPQRDRRPRIIVGYSFSNLNQETVRLAPPEAMQFGRALHRVITKVVHVDPKFGPCKLAKIDIADGFYRMWVLCIADILKLGVILPHNGGPPLVAFPLALPMGWVESPPYFTTLTETSYDLANASVKSGAPSLPHRLESSASAPPASDPPRWPKDWAATQGAFDRREVASAPLAVADVYVDNFLLAAQTKRHRQRLLCHTLKAIDDVLRPLSPDDPPHCKEPTSVKKLLQGDAHWSTKQENHFGLKCRHRGGHHAAPTSSRATTGAWTTVNRSAAAPPHVLVGMAPPPWRAPFDGARPSRLQGVLVLNTAERPQQGQQSPPTPQPTRLRQHRRFQMDGVLSWRAPYPSSGAGSRFPVRHWRQ